MEDPWEPGTAPTLRASPSSHKDKQMVFRSPHFCPASVRIYILHIQGKGIKHYSYTFPYKEGNLLQAHT